MSDPTLCSLEFQNINSVLSSSLSGQHITAQQAAAPGSVTYPRPSVREAELQHDKSGVPPATARTSQRDARFAAEQTSDVQKEVLPSDRNNNTIVTHAGNVPASHDKENAISNGRTGVTIQMPSAKPGGELPVVGRGIDEEDPEGLAREGAPHPHAAHPIVDALRQVMAVSTFL